MIVETLDKDRKAADRNVVKNFNKDIFYQNMSILQNLLLYFNYGFYN